MKYSLIWGCFVAVLLRPCMSDVYLHTPPGSNNRLNGGQANVRNANRLFDSQNNGKAGYNVGDKQNANPGENIPEILQKPMEFYMSGCSDKAKTEVEVMWTNQHGTGLETDDMVESQIILQFMCQPYPREKMATSDVNSEFEYHTIRNGQSSTAQVAFRPGHRENAYISKAVGLHEPANYYQSYYTRKRNSGLYTDDQKLTADRAIYTRQNPGGTRRGLEVPEERDYFPYWGPTPWKDIAIMVSDNKTEKLMKDYVNDKHYGFKYMCIMDSGVHGNPKCPPDNNNRASVRCVGPYITQEDCKKHKGRWVRFITNYLEKTGGVLSTCHGEGNEKLSRGVPYEAHKISQGSDNPSQFVLLHESPEVIFAPSTVVNHNGISSNGKFSSYKWKVPCFPTNITQRCVLRIRYNITSDDVPREFNASNNGQVKNNPTTKTVDGKTDLQLALNTAQVGRTFQDRSHVFILKARNKMEKKHQHRNIYYIFGMGKRGNIVQTYPAMEYRFFPERQRVTTEDVVCFVWSGSNNNPGGNAGNGQAGSDRTNVCWVKEGCSSLKPAACSSLPTEVVEQVVDYEDPDGLNLFLNKGCYTGAAALQNQLNNAPASCNPPCFRIRKPGKYCYMGTRNNNFSNRRHIGVIEVVNP